MSIDDKLKRDTEELQEFRRELGEITDPVPSKEADRRFAKMLSGQVPKKIATSRKPLHLRAAALMTLAAAVLFLVFGLGWYFGREDTMEVEDRLAATRTLMLELMQDRRSTTRMRAATVSLDLAVADPEIIGNLGYLLRTDESTNVRLAALDALLRFSGEESARVEMLSAMKEDPPPAVRVQLLETLVRLNEKRVLPYLKEMIGNDTLPKQLRDAAELGTFKLI